MVEPLIQEEQDSFHPGHGELDQLGGWEVSKPVNLCFTRCCVYIMESKINSKTRCQKTTKQEQGAHYL